MTLTKILMCTLLSYTAAHSMTINTVLNHNDIEPQIIKRIPTQDFPDMRLVCKKWATRGTDGKIKENWQFMPSNIEKRYDKIVKQYNHCSLFNKVLILFDLIEKDDNLVTWIVNRRPLSLRAKIDQDWLNQECILSADMLAKHYNKPEIARLLIETNHIYYENKNWKDVYHTLSIPKEIEECLPHDGNHDNAHNFSFIPYVIAAYLDNHHNLEKLYRTAKPTDLGQKIIITICLKRNSADCFNFLLTKNSTRQIIIKNNTFFFKITINHNQPKLAKKLIDKKLYPLNGYFVDEAKNKTTILDFYLTDENYKNNTHAHELLLSLGAKTWKQIEHEKRMHEERKRRERQQWSQDF